ncbi:putative ribonuclease H-like domain-containing protein [Tanacetum coccineum]
MTAIKIKKFYKKTGRRPRVDGKMHVAFDKRKVECFNCHNTGHFARECKFKGTKDGSRQEASRGQDFKPVRTEKEALMTIDEGQINWVEQTTDEEINHALMAFTVNNEVSMCSKLCLDSFNALKDKYDELQSEFGDQEAALTAHKIGLKKVEAQLRASHKQQISLNEKLHFQANQIFEKDEKFKQVEYKGVPHPLSGDYTPREQEDIDDSLDGEQGTVSDHSVHDDPTNIPSIEQVTIVTQKTQPQVPEPQQTVDPSCAQHVKTPRQPIKTPVTPSPIPSYNRQNWNQRMERELGAGSSFERKPCFVCGSLSHLIKDCDYYEKKMAREAALKRKRVVNTNDRQATPAWNNTNRINKHTLFTVHPRPVNPRPTLVTSGNSRFNTGKQHVSSGSVYVNSVTQFKSAASRVNTGKRYINSGCVHINTARVNRPMFNKPNPKPSQVKFNSKNKYFSKQSSPANRPFSRNTAYRSNIYAVKGKMGTAVKTSAGCVWRKTSPLSITNSGPIPDSYVHDHPLKHMEHRGIFDSGCSGHMTGNRAHLEDYQELSKVGSVTFGGSKGSISGKGTIRLGNLVFDDVAFVKELGHFNLFSISQICDKKLNVLFTEKECFVVSSDFKMPDENQEVRVCLSFVGEKGLKTEFSNARTPQQNGVAERMNRTLIEAARTMLADSLLPTTFWAEAVNTACYTFNRLMRKFMRKFHKEVHEEFMREEGAKKRKLRHKEEVKAKREKAMALFTREDDDCDMLTYRLMMRTKYDDLLFIKVICDFWDYTDKNGSLSAENYTVPLGLHHYHDKYWIVFSYACGKADTLDKGSTVTNVGTEEEFEDSNDDDTVTSTHEDGEERGAKGLTSPEQTATGKGISNPLMAVMICQKSYGIQLTNVSRVNTPGSDENRLKLYVLMYNIVKVADTRVKD